MTLNFTKMHGLGNDFIVLDGVSEPINLSPDQIRQLGNRHTGIGFDQLLIVAPATAPGHDFAYLVYNPDGSQAENCGNGARCFARFVRDQRLTNKKVIRVQTAKGVIELRVGKGGLITVDMGVPELNPPAIPFAADRRQELYTVDVGDETVELMAVSMGNPHGVLLVDNVDTAPVSELGPKLENHPRFPARANIGFLQILDRGHVRLRVFWC